METFCKGFDVEKNWLLGLSSRLGVVKFRQGFKVEYNEGKFAWRQSGGVWLFLYAPKQTESQVEALEIPCVGLLLFMVRMCVLSITYHLVACLSFGQAHISALVSTKILTLFRENRKSTQVGPSIVFSGTGTVQFCFEICFGTFRLLASPCSHPT